ncbi:tripartite motif-containing protein 75-like [Saccostrea echinata]|uniref:tripartite motif-containing protein 75-like n=1 Tax=Saccostrea echinata TaxID=191078 RepID=UPI002A8312AB|nr:tripartite motif-containing protein 75-like [Saccostrea echinata]
MADSKATKYPLGSPQEHIEMCEFHELPIDMICEDCDKFICAECAKTDHRNHDWKTLPTAASLRRRGLLNFMKKIKEEDFSGIDEKIVKMSKQVIGNKKLCDCEIKKLQKHYDEIMARLTVIKKHHEQTLRGNLVKINDQLNHVKSELEKKKRRIIDTVEFLEESNSTMSDYSLIDNHRELTKMLSELEVPIKNYEYSVTYTRGEINEDLIESLVGRITLDLDCIDVTQINSFQYGDNIIVVLETVSEEECYIREFKSKYIEKVNNQGAKRGKISLTPNDMCATDIGEVYFSDLSNKTIGRLSP